MIKIPFLYSVFGMVMVFALSISSSGGPDFLVAGAPGDSGTCSICHSGGTVFGSVSLTGAPSSYSPNTTYPLTLSVSDGDALVGGFQIVATDGSDNTMVGSFTPGNGTRVNGDSRLVQNAPKDFSGGSVSWAFTWNAPPPGSAPLTVVFYYAGNAADNSGGTSGDAIYNSNSSVPLPLEIVKFEVEKRENKSVDVTWQTASETNSDYFSILRASGQTDADFSEISRLPAAGNSRGLTNYHFTDEAPVAHQTSYYKLMQTDLDGKTFYSPIKSIKMLPVEEGQLRLYPNPVRNGAQLAFEYASAEANSLCQVKIFDVRGALVYTEPYPVQNGVNRFDRTIKDMPTGKYVLTLMDGNLVVAKKAFVVLE